MRNQQKDAARSYVAAKPATIHVSVTPSSRPAVHLALVQAGLNANEVRRMPLPELACALRWAILDGRITEEDGMRALVGIAPGVTGAGIGRGAQAEEGPLGRPR